MVDRAIEIVEGGFVYGGYRATLLNDSLAGGEGLIANPGRMPEDNHQLVVRAIESLVEAEPNYTLCIGGRKPTETAEHVPVSAREQLPGNNTITSLFIAEASADSFYEDPTASFEERLDFLFADMIHRGEYPSAHNQCAAREGFLKVMGNVLRLGMEDSERGRLYQARLIESLDGQVDDPIIRLRQILRQLDERYDLLVSEFNPDYVIAKVREHSPHGVNDLLAKNDRTHGHHEEVVIRERTKGAISPDLYHGFGDDRQAFVVSEDRLTKVARGMAHGDKALADLCQVAGNAYTDGVLTTIGYNLPTYRVEEL